MGLYIRNGVYTPISINGVKYPIYFMTGEDLNRSMTQGNIKGIVILQEIVVANMSYYHIFLNGSTLFLTLNEIKALLNRGYNLINAYIKGNSIVN